MPRPMRRPACWVPLLLLVIGNVSTLPSQVVTERPPRGTPTIVTAVASLTAWNDRTGTWLQWPAAPGASEYSVTRVDNSIPNPPEETIFKGPPTSFTFEGSDCSPTVTFKNCVFVDHQTYSRHFYSYRVWSTGGGPSPVASVTVRFGCDNLPRSDQYYCVPSRNRPR